MAKRTTATNWEIVGRDKDGAFVNIDYVCPYCDMKTGKLILIGASGVDCLDDAWETDQECEICGKDVTIICR